MTQEATLVISDNQLQIFAPELLGSSSGYCWLRGEDVIFDVNSDVAPLEVSRLHPDQINNRYWHYCDQSAVAQNQAGMRNCADLVWRHLDELKNKYNLLRVALVVPSHYQNHQLELLLAIAQAAGLTPTKVINKAVFVAASMGLSQGDLLTHVDVQLHQTVVSFLSADANGVHLKSFETIPGCSISGLQESILAALQASFIERDRFDPFHNALTEQQLFSQIEPATHTIASKGVATFNADLNTNLYTTSLDEPAFKAACESRFKALGDILKDASIVDFNSAFSQSLMSKILSEWGSTVSEVLDPQSYIDALSAFSKAAANSEQDEAAVDDVQYFNSIAHLPNGNSKTAKRVKPQKQAASSKPTKAESDSPANATHVQIGGVAVNVSQASITFTNGRMGLEVGEPNLSSSLAKGRITSVSGEPRTLPLTVGERLVSDLADGVITAIKVLS